jgi:hypothetical protein
MALDKLYFSRTGKHCTAAPTGGSDEERRALLKRRTCEEKLLRIFRDVLHVQMRKRHGQNYSIDMRELSPDEIAEAVLETAEYFLTSPDLEELRLRENAEDGAYYDINTNEKLPSDEEDLFAGIQKMERRIVWDSNLPLPDPIDIRYAFILGQTFDHEGDFWLRAQVKRGNENLFSFGVVNFLHCFPCLEIRRLRKDVVAAINKRKSGIPEPSAHYSSLSSLEEIQVIIHSFLRGKARLMKEIAELRPYCIGSYQISIFIARRCAALLLNENAPDLKPKIDEEWQKLFRNHPNVHGDTQLVQNALYLNAEILTKDKGVHKMAEYCGLKCVNC